MKKMTAPIVTKVIYISKKNNDEKRQYSLYIQNGADQMHKKYANPSKSKDDYIKQLTDKVKNNYNIEVTPDDLKSLEEETTFSPIFYNELNERILIRLAKDADARGYEEIVSEEIAKLSDEYKKDQGVAQLQYYEYIGKRQGTAGLFTDISENVEEIKKELNAYNGTIYLPIVSLKEKDAYLVGLENEHIWKDKGRKYVKEFAKVLGYDYNEIRWLAAYHEKPDEAINKNSDAGKQPHMHFMVWIPGDRQTQLKGKRSWEKLSRNELQRVRQRASSVFLDEYLMDLEKQEQELKEIIKQDGIMKNETIYQNMLWQSKILIESATNKSGRKNYQTFITSKDILKNMVYKLETNQGLTPGEHSQLARLGVEPNKRSVYERYVLYESLLSKLNTILDQMLTNKNVKAIYDEWISTRYQLTSSWASSSEQTDIVQKAENDLRRILLNQIIRSEDDWIDKVALNESSAGRLLEMINTGIFKADVDYENTKEYSKTYAQLLTTMGYTRTEIIDKISSLYIRSKMVYSTQDLVEIIHNEYDEWFKQELVVSVEEYNHSIKALQINFNSSKYPYALQSHKSPYPKMRSNIYDIITKSKTFYPPTPPKTQEEYEKYYQQEKQTLE